MLASQARVNNDLTLWLWADPDKPHTLAVELVYRARISFCRKPAQIEEGCGRIVDDLRSRRRLMCGRRVATAVVAAIAVGTAVVAPLGAPLLSSPCCGRPRWLLSPRIHLESSVLVVVTLAARSCTTWPPIRPADSPSGEGRCWVPLGASDWLGRVVAAESRRHMAQ